MCTNHKKKEGRTHCVRLLLPLEAHTGAGTTYFEDVWAASSQEDGRLTWTELTAAAPFSSRAFHTAVTTTFGGKAEVYVLGGQDQNGNVRGDVWRSEDGQTWNQVSGPVPWQPRWHHAAVYCQVGTDLLLACTIVAPGHNSCSLAPAWNYCVDEADTVFLTIFLFPGRPLGYGWYIWRNREPRHCISCTQGRMGLRWIFMAAGMHLKIPRSFFSCAPLGTY
jgi:hypothetical protein